MFKVIRNIVVLLSVFFVFLLYHNMNEEQEKEKYFQSNSSRPDKNLSGGYGKYCCIPGCKSSTKDSLRQNTGISLFQIPNKEPEKTNWIKILSNYRRKGTGDNFDPRNNTYFVCEFHFKADDIKVSHGIGRKTIRTGILPSVFREAPNTPARKPPRKRPLPVIETSSESVIESDDEGDYVPNLSNLEPIEETEDEKNAREKAEMREQINILKNNNDTLLQDNEKIQNRMYSFKNISKNEEQFRKATGLSVEKFNVLLEFLNPGEDCSNIKFHDTTKRLNEETFTHETLEYKNKPGRMPRLDPKEQLFLYLAWLKNGFTLGHLAFLFDISTSTASRYIITWSNLCYFSLGSVPIWPTREQVNDTMPTSFKNTYPSTRCIIDCTEIFCQRPSSLSTQSSLYSHYKSHVTYKGLVGISPSGAITFVSQLFDGSISDKAIVKQSGFLQKCFWNEGDSVMADRGFLIEDDLKQYGVKLNIPAFLKGRDQLTSAEVKESQTIASVRIHVERAIQRLKRFKILRNEIPLTLHGSVNQIWTVCCLLCNLMTPLIQENENE